MDIDDFCAKYGVTLYANTDQPSPGNPTLVVRQQTHLGTGVGIGCGLWMWCPGCDAAHCPQAVGADGTPPIGPCWNWNEDPISPTLDPSILVTAGPRGARCHSYLRDGHWQFLDDCSHALKGKTVPMVPLPDWLVKE